MAKRKRVLILEVPARTPPQKVKDVTAFLTAKLIEAGYPDVLILPVEDGMKLGELFSPRPKEETKWDHHRLLELSEAMYQELAK